MTSVSIINVQQGHQQLFGVYRDRKYLVVFISSPDASLLMVTVQRLPGGYKV